jgi:hypothetical protein
MNSQVYLSLQITHGLIFSESNTSSVQIPGQFNFSTLVRINATDIAVGNWSVRITANDTGSPTGEDFEILNLYIANKNDSVSIQDITNKEYFISNDNTTIYANATDFDLLIPTSSDPSVYDEEINFTSNNTNVTIVGVTEIPGTNIAQAEIYINFTGLGVGDHAVNISVTDSNGFSTDSDVFTISILDNDAPYWNSTTPQNHSLTEDIEFTLNLSEYAHDPDGSDDLNFTYVNYTQFDNFDLDGDTGIINFTPRDIDVGFHEIDFTVKDGKSDATLLFNFTVANVHDNVTITQVQLIGATPTSVNEGESKTIYEDNETKLILLVKDDDFNITNSQISFYDELVTINANITGPNSSLFSFDGITKDTSSQPDGVTAFFETYDFYPGKNDVGDYNITINVTDAYGNSDTISFNLTISEIEHDPEFLNIENQILSIENETLYYDINATDLEDGDDSQGNLTFTLGALTTGGQFLTINETTGVINFTTNNSLAGLWEYQVNVSDKSFRNATAYFNLTIYDYPQFILPAPSTVFNMTENVTYQMNFTINHTVQDQLNYTLIINGETRNSTTGNGNATTFFWDFTPGFLDETTCSGPINLTLNVSNSKLSNATSWSLNINHTNYPLTFNTTIPDPPEAGSPISLTLSEYFIDYDASDSCVNQSVTFAYTLVPNSTSGASISVSFTNWINTTTPEVDFAASDTASANYSITAFEYPGQNTSETPLLNTTSNNFTVSLTPSSDDNPVPTPQPTSSSGGGSGGSGNQIIALKIIVPEPVTAKQKDKLIIPLRLVNEGDVDLEGITLTSIIAKDGLLRTDLVSSFDVSYFDELEVDESRNVTMIVDIDTADTGLFEITINGTVEDPEYMDWAKMYIEIEEEFDILERIIFTEEFVIGNPACAEFKDLINEAKQLYDQGLYDEALVKSEGALDACRQAITQPPLSRVYERIGDRFFTYAAIASLGAFGAGFVYYYYRRVRLKSQLGHIQGKL